MLSSTTSEVHTVADGRTSISVYSSFLMNVLSIPPSWIDCKIGLWLAFFSSTTVAKLPFFTSTGLKESIYCSLLLGVNLTFVGFYVTDGTPPLRLFFIDFYFKESYFVPFKLENFRNSYRSEVNPSFIEGRMSYSTNYFN
jgi:hypothetical protein